MCGFSGHITSHAFIFSLVNGHGALNTVMCFVSSLLEDTRKRHVKCIILESGESIFFKCGER